jgi:hypothetical protein
MQCPRWDAVWTKYSSLLFTIRDNKLKLSKPERGRNKSRQGAYIRESCSCFLQVANNVAAFLQQRLALTLSQDVIGHIDAKTEKRWRVKISEHHNHHTPKMNRSARRCIWRYRVWAGVWNCQIRNQVVESQLSTYYSLQNWYRQWLPENELT